MDREDYHRLQLISELENTLLLLDYIVTEVGINPQLRDTINQRIVDREHLYNHITGNYFVKKENRLSM